MSDVSRGPLAHTAPDVQRGKAAKTPFYPQLLRLKNVHPNAWQRALFGEGMALIGVLLAMADLASAWSILVLPVAVAVIVKCHDVLAGLLRDRP
jgi:hypothetical protein